MISWSEYIHEYFSINDDGTTSHIADFIFRKHPGAAFLKAKRQADQTGDYYNISNYMHSAVYGEISNKLYEALQRFVKNGFLKKKKIHGRFKVLYIKTGLFDRKF